MKNGISLRIRKIIDELYNGNKSEFARIVGISESNVRSYLGDTVPKADVLIKIATKIAISCEWLLLGKGDMLQTVSDVSPSQSSPDNSLLLLIHEKDIKIEEQAKMIGRLEERLLNFEASLKKNLATSVVKGVGCADAEK